MDTRHSDEDNQKILNHAVYFPLMEVTDNCHIHVLNSIIASQNDSDASLWSSFVF